MAAVTLKFSQADGETAFNAMHAWNGGTDAWTSEDLSALASAVGEWVHTGDGGGHTYIAQVSQDAQFVSVTCRDLTAEDGPEATTVFATAGEDTSTPFPQGVSWVVSLRTGLSGRSYRGRVYLIGLCADSLAEDQFQTMSATASGSLIAAFGALDGVISGAVDGSHLSVLSRSLDGARRETGVATPVTAIGYSNLTLDYQRRRAPNHNRHR